jgi:hypothetical protein
MFWTAEAMQRAMPLFPNFPQFFPVCLFFHLKYSGGQGHAHSRIMNGVAPSEKNTATGTLEKRLWAAADNRARELETAIASKVAENLET